MNRGHHNGADRILGLGLALLAGLVSMPAFAQMQGASIIFSAGDVLIVAKDGTHHAATKGQDLDAGDTVLTGQGRVQLGFSDGGIVDLAPDGAFRVDDYVFDGAE